MLASVGDIKSDDVVFVLCEYILGCIMLDIDLHAIVVAWLAVAHVQPDHCTYLTGRLFKLAKIYCKR
jgi:hypothetical protein